MHKISPLPSVQALSLCRHTCHVLPPAAYGCLLACLTQLTAFQDLMQRCPPRDAWWSFPIQHRANVQFQLMKFLLCAGFMFVWLVNYEEIKVKMSHQIWFWVGTIQVQSILVRTALNSSKIDVLFHITPMETSLKRSCAYVSRTRC